MPCDSKRILVEEKRIETAFQAIEAAMLAGRLRVSTDSLGRPIIEGWTQEIGFLKNTVGMTDLCICDMAAKRQSLAWKQATAVNPRLKNVVEMHAAAHRAGGHH